MEFLNVPFIQKRIEQAHKNFLDSVGEMPVKITSDHKLFLARTSTRIKTILDCFLASKVIDKVGKEIERSDGDESCCVFKLTKKGFDRAVYIWTDGFNITIKTAHYPHQSGLNLEDDVVIRNIDFDEYNWVEFSDKLLPIIVCLTDCRHLNKWLMRL
jgi:hypothetical protein